MNEEMSMAKHTPAGWNLDARRGHPRSRRNPADEHIGALVGALTVLDTRLLDDWGQRLAVTLRRGSRLLTAGNGGSAAQAQHVAAEFTGRFAADRPAYSAIALHAETSTVTAIANDYGYDEVFARQVRAHGRPGDVLLVLSTSGRSRNLLRAVTAAKAGGIDAWCLTGPAPNPLAEACDEAVCVYPAGARALALTATVQEAHQVALHLICLSFDATALNGDDPVLDGPVLDGPVLDGTAPDRVEPRAADAVSAQEVAPWTR
jgi:D-sedoheptulose 7-phosphate isomerase